MLFVDSEKKNQNTTHRMNNTELVHEHCVDEKAGSKHTKHTQIFNQLFRRAHVLLFSSFSIRKEKNKKKCGYTYGLGMYEIRSTTRSTNSFFYLYMHAEHTIKIKDTQCCCCVFIVVVSLVACWLAVLSNHHFVHIAFRYV